ncbi:hypothetical protein L1887_23655 [Cichorium endivia]|nr:hypothetical protein L1887_23655 [Cichorium endivia]
MMCCYRFEGMRREVEDVPELLQHIQSRLLVREAARTSVLSKSWLHAWSTIPNLRFHVVKKQNLYNMKLVDVDRTLIRYHHDNIPIEKFELLMDIDDQESASHAEKWIGFVATKTCLKEVSLTILLHGVLFTLPHEILSVENLTKIQVSSPFHSVNWMTTNHVIKCVSLRELHLDGVRISEEALNDILSSCSLLVKIELLHCCEGLKTINVKNLACLYELTICAGTIYGNTTDLEISDVPNLIYGNTTDLEISDVPNLGVFSFDLRGSHSISLGTSVTQLTIGGRGMITDYACMDMINSRLPFLECLTLYDMTFWKSESFHFTCASIKRLTLGLCPHTLVDIQVHAPKLRFFCFDGYALPNILFPVSTLKQLDVTLRLDLPVDVYFFLKMREALSLAHTCTVRIMARNHDLGLDLDLNQLPSHIVIRIGIDIDDLRTRLRSPPATNVQQLSFQMSGDDCLWERSLFFDAFFEICRPKHVFALPDLRYSHRNHFCRLMLKEVLEKKTTSKVGTPYWSRYLKHVQIREYSRDQIWKTLTNSHRHFLDGSAPADCMDFKLMWC